uniref:Tudor domain-containing protein 1 n=1 Tax=Strix occidentalis caurina TaxID=311401 RepID=A0A8D0EH35_STROC
MKFDFMLGKSFSLSKVYKINLLPGGEKRPCKLYPKKLQYSFENAFSIGYDKSLFSSLIPPPQMKTCHHCGLFGSLRCSQCKQIYYCSADCQKKDWRAHSVVCEPGNSTSVDSLKTEDHVEKIMLSDLQTLGIKKAMKGTVTEFKSPREFYIQMSSPEVLDQISKLSAKLQDCYANKVIQEQYIAVKGEVCVARCTLDQTWSRALVKDLDISQKKAQVFYIDYGNEENIPLSWIKALHKDTELLFPPCAIKCSFANYDPKEKGWSEGIDNIYLQLIGKHCSVTVVDVLQEEMMLSFAVDDVVPDFGKCLVVYMGGKKNPTQLIAGSFVCVFFWLQNKNNIVVRASCVSVCIGDAFSGVVSSIQNPENFFCQQVHSARQLAELQVSLNEHCGKSPSSPAFHPPAGNVCCAQFTEDDLWYRAAVIQYVSEDTVLVGYIDYGNFEVLPLTRLRPMISRLMDLPAQAIRCTLAGVKPPSRPWTSKAISFMNQLVKDKVLTVKVMDKESDRSVVELIDASVIPVINIASHFREKGFAAEDSRMALPATGMSDVKPANEYAVKKKIYKWSRLTLKQTVDVVVCALYNPGEFYCQISNNSGTFIQLFSFYDGNWYRALVKNVTSDGTVRVCFVDYGNIEEVPLDKIRQISSSFLKLPFQGIKCWLSGIKPGNSKWIPEATARFCMYTAGKKLQARVTSLSRDGAGVELIDSSTGHPKISLLEDMQLSLKFKKICCNSYLECVCVWRKVVHCIFLLFLLETSLANWKLIELAIDETISVRVTEVVSPDLFYAVPVQIEDQEKLHRQLIELDSYCKSCKNQPFKPKLGEPCCARFSGDGRWYRALVLQNYQSVVKVLYADYGNTETLPLSKVLPITDSYLKLPFQTIMCSLAVEAKCCCTELKMQVRFSRKQYLLFFTFPEFKESLCGEQIGVGR